MNYKVKFSLLTAAFFVAPALAAVTTIKAIPDSAPYSPAYQFEVTSDDGLGIYSKGEQFRTFCLEAKEVFYLNQSYYAVINTGAVTGGELSGFDPLDPRTAYLYTNYVNGVYGYDVDTEKALQEAIHVLEGERGSVSVGSPWSLKAADFLAQANASKWTGIGNVRVINLWTDYDPATGTYSGLTQDQLVIVPTPAALLLASVGMSVVGYLKRRRSI